MNFFILTDSELFETFGVKFVLRFECEFVRSRIVGLLGRSGVLYSARSVIISDVLSAKIPSA